MGSTLIKMEFFGSKVELGNLGKKNDRSLMSPLGSGGHGLCIGLNGRGETTKPHNLFSTAYIIEITSFSRVPLYENEIVLHQNYLEKGLTVKEMCVLLGCGSTTIKKQLRRFNIRKTEVQEVRHKSNLRKGKKLRHK